MSCYQVYIQFAVGSIGRHDNGAGAGSARKEVLKKTKIHPTPQALEGKIFTINKRGRGSERNAAKRFFLCVFARC